MKMKSYEIHARMPIGLNAEKIRKSRVAYAIENYDIEMKVIKFPSCSERDAWICEYPYFRDKITTKSFVFRKNGRHVQCYVDAGNAWQDAQFFDRTKNNRPNGH